MTEPQTPLPASVDVVVIGGGIVGVTAAWLLARDGLSVALLEKGRIAGEQSSRNWGWIRKQGRDARELPLMIESARLWEDLAGEVGAETIGFGRNGTTYLALDDQELAKRAAWLEAARDFQLDTRLLTAAETDDLLGRDDRFFAGALHTPSDMTAEPGLAVPAFARKAAADGVTVVEGCAARGVETTGGRLSGIVTERGTIACNAAILGGGVWSRPFLENLGVFIPQLAVRSSAARTTPAPLIHSGGIGATGASLRRRPDGGYTLGRTASSVLQVVPAAFRHLPAFLPTLFRTWGMAKIRIGKEFFGPLGHTRWSNDQVTPMERHRVLDPAPDTALLAAMLADAKRYHPKLGDVKIAEGWGGMIDVTPDEVPIIDETPGTPGLWIATGLSGHGFGIGPGVGRVAAQLVGGRTPVVDPSPFLLSRFRSKGSREKVPA